MKYVFLSILLSVLIFSCKEEKLSLTMDKEKLIDVLADMHVAEEMIGKFRDEDKDSVRSLYMEEISEIHKLDTATIFTEIRLIQDHPELGLEVYSEVYNRLEKYSKTYDKSNKAKDKDKADQEKSEDEIDNKSNNKATAPTSGKPLTNDK